MEEHIELKSLGLEPLDTLTWRKSLGQHVFENLKGAIIRGDMPPGNRLVESRIADALGISRTPVREAIHKLEREGLLRKLPQGGFFVVGLTREDIEETFGIRSVLESYAARLAAIKHRQEELRPLEEKVDEFQTCLDRGKMDRLPKINTEFHDLLYALCRSPKLIKMINNLREQIYRFRKIILKMEEMAKTSNDDHKEMLKAMKKRDADRVEALVRAHILRGQSIVMNQLKDRTGEF
jgi:DNA-binding GntR family transcriptional regulator